MREQEMRERADRFLRGSRQRAWVAVLGMGIALGGCATSGVKSTPVPSASSKYADEEEALPCEAKGTCECVAIYSAPAVPESTAE
jgi:hypothetical protein